MYTLIIPGAFTDKEEPMEILQIVAIGLIATILVITLKQQKPELAIHISIAAGLFIFFLIVGKLGSIIDVVNKMVQKAQIDTVYLSTLFKIIGIAYITEFGADICRDAGEGAIASKIELGGKVIIMVMALPILAGLMEVILNIMS